MLVPSRTQMPPSPPMPFGDASRLDAGLVADPVAAPVGQLWAPQIASREEFELLARRDDVPGAIGVREVKYLISDVDTPEPQVHFMNTNEIEFHFHFARDVLGEDRGNAVFNAVTYFTDNREYLAGTVLAHDSFPGGLYAMEFWPTDPVSTDFVSLAWREVSAGLSFAQGQVAYHPSGATQHDLYLADEQRFADESIRVVTSSELFANVTYSPLNLGVGFGRLRIVQPTDTQPPTATDVVIFTTLPNDLSHVAGVISEAPQTPLSHINLKAKQNNTPNAYLKDASTDPRVVANLGQYIRYEVTADDIVIAPVTAEEAEAFLESQRPLVPQRLPRDLTTQAIAPLDQLGHTDLVIVGAKAANLAELRQAINPQIVPDGFAIPFSFYDHFMTETGLYAEARDMVSKSKFNDDPARRDDKLKDFRRMIKDSDVPEVLHAALGDLHQQFDPAQPLRCRSSTNNEDLVGFNGAGLYDSFTHRPDEGHLSKSIKQVWASLWNFRAFEEREFHRIDHFQAAMGVLVHPNFDDEMANGVALTRNIYFPDFRGYYINSQVGESLITNPTATDVPEELLLMEDVDLSTAAVPVFETIYIRRSNLAGPSRMVLTQPQIDLLSDALGQIQAHFAVVYDRASDPTFAMDVEFKIDVAGTLAIKQARPWVD